MIRYLVVSFATISLILASGCTSKKVEGEADATAEMAEDGSEVAEGGDEIAAESEATTAESGSSDFSEDDFGSDETVAESAPAEEAPAEGFDEAPADSTVAETAPPADDLATTEEATLDTSVDSMGTDVADSGSDLSSDAGSSDLAMSDSTSSLGSDESSGLSEEPPAPKPVVPLKKIQTTPWTQAGILLNAVYIARPGDDFKSVSQKIYGSEDKASELKKVNPTIAARKMKVGDKVYYNSPKRPTDNMQLMTFYEDLGLSPEIYVAAPGDNVRDVAQKLLGDTNSWKELWSTNLDVESKGDLPEGTRLRYWAGDLVAQAPAPEAPMPMAPDMAHQMPTEAPPMPEEAPAPPAMADIAPPPSEPPPPPPPMMAEAPPVPAEVPPMGAPEDAGPLSAILGDGGDQTTALMIGAILLIAAVALFIIIRKRKARRNIDFQTATHTHID